MKIIVNRKILAIKISNKRREMYLKANTLGYTHPIVVACSQDLDLLINRYQGICS